MSEIPWDFQIKIWGFALFGPDEPNQIATIAEQGHAWNEPVWDRTAADLVGSLRSIDGGGYEQVPDYWALPGVTELLLRRGCGWMVA